MSFYSQLPLDELSDLVARHPDEIDLRLALVEHHVRQHGFQDALAQVCMAEDLGDNSPELAAWKSLCLIFAGDIQIGHELLMRVVRNNPCCDFQTRLITELVPLFIGKCCDPAQVDWVSLVVDEHTAEELPAGFVERNRSYADALAHLHHNEDQGIEHLKQHIQEFPEDINARLCLAIACCGAQQLDLANQYYREVLEQDEQCATAWFDLAAIIDDPDESVELTKNGLMHCPSAQHARYNLGMFMFQLGDLQGARRELSRIPADHRIYVEALVATGMSYEEEGDFPNAVECLEKASILQPDRADVRGKYGQLLCDCGLFHEALAELERSIQLDESQYCVWANKGLLHLHNADYELALDALQCSLNLNPHSEDAAINLAVLLADTGKLDEAIQILVEAIQLHPHNGLICQNLGAFYCDKRQLEDALRFTERSIELGVDSPAIYWNLANIYCFKNQRRKCLNSLAKAIERDDSLAAQFRVDKDFQKYWNDPDFVRMIDDYCLD